MSRMFENGIEDFCCPGSVGVHGLVGRTSQDGCAVMMAGSSNLFSFLLGIRFTFCKDSRAPPSPS